MAGIANRWGVRAAQWLLDAVMMRRLPLWQRCLLAVLLVLIFVAPPVTVAAALTVLGVSRGKPLILLLSIALVATTVWFWVCELRKYHRLGKP